MKILVTGGSGTIGTRTVSLLAPLAEVSIASRGISSGTRPGIENLIMDFQDPRSIQQALVNKDKVVLITPASETESEDGVRFVELAHEAKIKHIVFLGIHNVTNAAHIPHFKSKINIHNALKKSGMKWTVIAANNFYQNDYSFKEAILKYNTYPQPFGDIGLNRVDANDIAQAITNALFDESFENEEYPLIGPQSLTAHQTAEIYSRLLKKEIKYRGNNLDSWEMEIKKFIPEWLAADWKLMYRFFQDEGLRASAADLIKQGQILKRAPRSFELFAQETVQAWSK